MKENGQKIQKAGGFLKVFSGINHRFHGPAAAKGYGGQVLRIFWYHA